MTKASLSGLAFLIDLAQERDSPGGFAALDPPRVCGACGLRWKTLRVSSAPHPRGFEFLCGQQKSEPFGPASAINLAEREGFAGRRAPPSLRCAPAALAGYAGKRLTPFPQLRTLAGSNPCEGNEKASNWARFIT